MKTYNKDAMVYSWAVVFIIGVWLLAGCGSNAVQQIPTTVETFPARPATVSGETMSTATPPAGPNVPGGVPVIPNASRVTGKVISISTEEAGVFVELLVTSSEPISGFADLGANVVGTQIKAKWLGEGAAPFAVDQVITGELRYAGDEYTDLYLLSQVENN